jgi:hypothetical protein
MSVALIPAAAINKYTLLECVKMLTVPVTLIVQGVNAVPPTAVFLAAADLMAVTVKFGRWFLPFI